MPEYLCRRLQQEAAARLQMERERESVKPLLRHISEEERSSLVTVSPSKQKDGLCGTLCVW